MMIQALGMMSGTSLDGVDAALIETDGLRIAGFGRSAFRAYSGNESGLLHGALGQWPGGPDVAEAAALSVAAHADLAAGFPEAELVGYHGQTLAHDPGGRGTHQAGNGAALARRLGRPVVWDFRSEDLRQGGEGAPLAPFFHWACAEWAVAQDLLAPRPLGFLNLGGVGNLTVADPAAPAPEAPGACIAFDTGPANAPLNDLMRARLGLERDQGGALAAPVLCHNRRAGARNAVLWPLPDQHSIGLPGFDPDAAPDPIPWEDKLDQVVWRGMISGSEMTGGIRPRAASHAILRDLAAGSDDPERRQAAWDRLCNTNRLAFVRQWWGHPDFDLGVVMAWRFRDFARDPLIAPYCTPRQDRAFFHRFRYQLCLSGYDHGSNFMGAIDAQSVLLAEDDGWEVFYSGRFQPWKHYIPLERYCGDIDEKLAWARRNPQQCKAMSAAARHEAALLRKPATRRAIMARILDGLAAAG